MSKKKVKAYITDVSDDSLSSFSRNHHALVEYKFEINGKEYKGIGSIAPLLAWQQGNPKGMYMRERYIGGWFYIYYNSENPEENMPVYESKHGKTLNWLHKKGGTWKILFIIFIIVPLLTFLFYRWSLDNPNILFEILGGRYG